MVMVMDSACRWCTSGATFIIGSVHQLKPPSIPRDFACASLQSVRAVLFRSKVRTAIGGNWLLSRSPDLRSVSSMALQMWLVFARSCLFSGLTRAVARADQSSRAVVADTYV